MEAAAFSLSVADHDLGDSAIASIFFMVPKVYKPNTGKVDVNAHPLMSVHRFTVVNLGSLDDSVSTFGTKCSIFGTCFVVF